MLTTVERPTSITIANTSEPRFTQDHQTRKWALSENASGYPRRAELLKYAQRELANLRRLPEGWDGGNARGVRSELANVALALIDAVTRVDGLATPQFTPLADGGLEVTWLVGGDRLVITLEPEVFSIRGVLRDGHELLSFERRYGEDFSSELETVLRDAQRFLLKISARVRHQLL